MDRPNSLATTVGYHLHFVDEKTEAPGFQALKKGGQGGGITQGIRTGGQISTTASPVWALAEVQGHGLESGRGVSPRLGTGGRNLWGRRNLRGKGLWPWAPPPVWPLLPDNKTLTKRKKRRSGEFCVELKERTRFYKGGRVGTPLPWWCVSVYADRLN